jgi:hypothetical protein
MRRSPRPAALSRRRPGYSGEDRQRGPRRTASGLAWSPLGQCLAHRPLAVRIRGATSPKKKQTPVPGPSGHGRPQILPHWRPAPWGKVLQFSKNGPALQCRVDGGPFSGDGQDSPRPRGFRPSRREIRLSAATRPAVGPEKAIVLLKRRVYPDIFHVFGPAVKPPFWAVRARRALSGRHSLWGMALSPSIEGHSPQGIARSPASRGIPLL